MIPTADSQQTYRFAKRILPFCLIISYLLTVSQVVTAKQASKRNSRPNVIVILTDDQGWGDLSIHGNRNLETPNIDSLAEEGVRFDRFYVCPVCSPTRAEFLTGRYHPRSGVYSTSAGGERMDADETTIAELFRDSGYATAAFGKWHNGMQWPYHPNARGFEEYYGFCSGHWGNYFSPMLEQNGQIVQGEGFVIDDFTTHAIDFMTSHQDEPFFVYLPYNTPHSPMQVPDRWWNKFADRELTMRHLEPKKENQQFTRAALAMCENIDWNVGRLLETLDDLQLDRQTIVIYFSDNGPNGRRWNGGMKGRKGSTDEGGVRSPLLMRWRGTIPPGSTIEQIASVTDLLPTLAHYCQVPLSEKLALDGRPVDLVNQPEEVPDRLIFTHWRNRVSVRNQRFRLDNDGQLFDIPADPGQYRDVSDQFPEIAAQLQQAADRWKQEVLAGYDNDRRPFVIGHRDSIFTQLPARDAQVTGGIKRSNRFPNCSFYTNWTSPDEEIYWEAEVDQAGTYEVELYYTCRAEDAGAEIELSFQDSRLTATIQEAHDPPLIGAAEDRIKRKESYVKAFHPLSLGTISLPSGRGRLSLKATKIPGAQVIDFRLLMLKRVDE